MPMDMLRQAEQAAQAAAAAAAAVVAAAKKERVASAMRDLQRDLSEGEDSDGEERRPPARGRQGAGQGRGRAIGGRGAGAR